MRCRGQAVPNAASRRSLGCVSVPTQAPPRADSSFCFSAYGVLAAVSSCCSLPRTGSYALLTRPPLKTIAAGSTPAPEGHSLGYPHAPFLERLPSKRLHQALPNLFWFTPTFPTCPTVAEQFSDIKWTFLEAPATLANCPPFPSVISILCMTVPKDISVEVDSFFLSTKTPSQTVHASYKAYGFQDIDDDIYTDESYIVQ
ncbi:hypothetical protein M9H77_17201 [Catharanthus roseus]|uniref:Uncharacterized protein n=1 Tax=Catharanthus roseus TaxID=4058 RepID=A0ACC0B3Z0_CATRO|nr:hypothetical protein M9H77_17201 [Catharanthus roseus]